MIKIGQYEYISTHIFLIPKDETVSLNLDVGDGGIPLKINIKFEENSDDSKSAVKVNIEDELGIFTFINWSTPLGTSMQKPVSFAVTDTGEDVFFLANGTKSGSVYSLTIQFMKKD